MARPEKLGLDYFPLDVDIFESDKMLAISGEFAVKGEIITLRVLCEIYRNGYFVEYSELLKNKLARLSGLSANLIEEVIGKLVKYGFFDESVFREHSVLTSKGIQKRYLEAVKRRKNVLCEHYWLLNGVNVYINPTSTGINDNISTQSKVKESKVNKNDFVDSRTHAHEALEDPVGEPPKPAWRTYPIPELVDTLIASTAWKESVCMQYRLKPGDVDSWIATFAGHLKASGEDGKTLRDAKKHFSSWLRIQLEKPHKPANGQSVPTDGQWRTDRSKIPTHPGDWRWSTIANRWMNRDNMNGTDQKKYGVDR